MGSLGNINGALFNGEPTACDHSHNVLYEIKKDPVVGRYMVASRDIQPGEVIFTDSPVAIGPDNSSKPLCLGCFGKVNGSFVCPGCKWPMCSPKCCKAPSHLSECRLLTSRGAKIKIPWFDKPCSYYDAVLPLRVLLLKKYNPAAYHLVSILMDHNDNLDETTVEKRNKIVDFIRINCALAKDFDPEEIHHILGILSVNSFVVHDGGEDEVNTDLIGLYPWTSIMSHNCTANTKITTRDDFSYVCESTVFIAEGQEIVTDYHHYHYQLYGTSYRRNDLKSTWSFDCLCHRCADPTELGTYVSGVNCEECKVGTLLPKNPLDYNSEWQCVDCQSVVFSKVIEMKIKTFEDQIDDIKGDDAESYEKLLRKMRYHLHENHYWILDVKRRLIDIYGNKEGYQLHTLPQELLDRKREFCEHLLSVTTKLSPGASELRGYLLWELFTVKNRVNQSAWIRMKISTPCYLDELIRLEAIVKEVVAIFGPIRTKSDEGQTGLKAKKEYREMQEQIKQLSMQCQKNAVTNANRLSSISVSTRHTENTLENTLSKLLRDFPKAAVINTA